MNKRQHSFEPKTAGYVTLAATITMTIGVIFWVLSGTDIDMAVTSDMAAYLEQAAAARFYAVANISFWIAGVLLFGAAGTLMAHLDTSQRATALLAGYAYRTAAPLVVASYVAMLVVIVQIAPDTSAEGIQLGRAIGWYGSRADWIGTILVLGIGPALLGQAGKDSWLPRWLTVWALVALAAGGLTALALFTNALGSYGFLIIPAGMTWHLATGIYLVRHRQPVAQPAATQTAQAAGNTA